MKRNIMFKEPRKAYRVITDEPQGTCVDFDPGPEFDCDVFLLPEEADHPGRNSYGDIDEIYVFTQEGDIAITLDEDYDRRWGQTHFSREPELHIWYTKEEFEKWVEENV